MQIEGQRSIDIAAPPAVVWALAASGSFLQNLTLSVASRLITYGLVCAALPVLRRRKSTFIHGAEDDAREVVDHLARYLA